MFLLDLCCPEESCPLGRKAIESSCGLQLAFEMEASTDSRLLESLDGEDGEHLALAKTFPSAGMSVNPTSCFL